jgi:hypothetical protein
MKEWNDQQWRQLFVDVVKHTIEQDEEAARVVDVGFRLAARRAKLLGRSPELWIDVTTPLIYLCWWPFKPSVSGEIRKLIVKARRRTIADHGYDAIVLSDELLMSNPFGKVSSNAGEYFAKLRDDVLAVEDDIGLSNALLLSSIPIERSVGVVQLKTLGYPVKRDLLPRENLFGNRFNVKNFLKYKE